MLESSVNEQLHLALRKPTRRSTFDLDISEYQTSLSIDKCDF